MRVGALAACCAALVAALLLRLPATAATTAGTTIDNQAKIVYTDPSNPGVTFVSISQIWVYTIQNVPGLSIAGNGHAIVAPGQSVSDTFTVTNTGNGNGTLGLSASVTGPNSTAVTATYTLENASGTVLASGTLAQVNAYLASSPGMLAQGASDTLVVTYTANAGGGGAGSYSVSVGGTILQSAIAAVTGVSQAVPAQSSSVPSTSVTDAAGSNPEVDVALSETAQNATTATYAVAINDSGSPAYGINAAGTLLGLGAGAADGILIAQKVPLYNGTPLVLSGTPAFASVAANGYSGNGATIYYAHAPSGAAGSWNQSTTAPVYYVAVFIQCPTSTACLGTHAGSSAGSVPSAAGQLTVSYTVPSGAGAPGAFSSIANVVAGGSAGATTIVGPGITSAQYDATTSAATSAVASAIANGTDLAGPSGASHLVASTGYSAPVSYGVLNGPAGNPSAVGDYSSSGYPSQTHDFTGYVFFTGTASSGSPSSTTTAGSSGNGTTVSIAPSSVFRIRHTLRNTGTAADRFYVSVPSGLSQMPASWSIALYCANSDGSINYGCPISATTATPSIPANTTLDYYTEYTSPAATAITMSSFQQYSTTIRATSAGGSSTCGTTTCYDDTQDVVFVNGFVKLLKTATVSSSMCPSTVTPGYTGVNPLACSGAKITYTISYQNLMPPAGTNNVALTATPFVLSENGAGPGGWSQFTTGLVAAPADSLGGTITCSPGPACANATSFTDGPLSLAPHGSGSVTFSVTVK